MTVTEVPTGRVFTVGPDNDACWRPSFSPGGERLAFYCAAGNRGAQAWVYELASRQLHPPADAVISPDPAGGDRPVWSPDGKEVFVPIQSLESLKSGDATTAPGEAQGVKVGVYRSGKESTDSSGEDPPAPGVMAAGSSRPPPQSASLAAIDVDTGKVRVIEPGTRSALRVPKASPSGRWIASISGSSRPRERFPRSLLADLVVVPAAGGAKLPIASGIAGNDSLESYIWHPDRDQLFWVKEGRLWTADAQHGFEGALALAPGLDHLEGPLAITRNGRVLIAAPAADRLEAGAAQALVAVPLDGGPLKRLHLPPGLQFGNFVIQRDSRLWQPENTIMAVTARVIETGETAIVSLNLDSGSGRMVWTGRATLELAGSDGTHRVLFGAYEDMDTPRDVYRFSPDFHARSRLSEVEPRFAKLRLGRVEAFRVALPQHDGRRTIVTSALLLPAHAKQGVRLPTLAVIYPRASFIDSAARFGGGHPSSLPAGLLTTRGYAVLLTTAPVHPRGTPGNLSSELAEVLLPQVQAAVDLGYTDAARVAIMGESFGGYSVALIASASDRFRAGIAIAGVYDLTYAASSTFNAAGDGPVFALEYHYGMSGHPWADMAQYMDNSPFFRADRIRAPLLMIHGKRDPVPVEDARKMFNALRLLGRTAQYAEYADEGHVIHGPGGYWSSKNSVDAGQRIIGFLDKYLKPAN